MLRCARVKGVASVSDSMKYWRISGRRLCHPTARVGQQPQTQNVTRYKAARAAQGEGGDRVRL
jgi:hypothetical protein